MLVDGVYGDDVGRGRSESRRLKTKDTLQVLMH